MANQDPNKYAKNKDIKPESPLSNMAAIGKMGLMIAGIIGIALEFFKEDGVLKTILAKLFQSTTTMLFIPVIIFVLWLLNRWMSSSKKGETNKSGDLPMYAMMAVGAYYLFRLITTGSM
ncbi:MAG TPA: hypothetical protein VK967_01915 [Methylotenera sp.]|nr:hypothetical protein [Methylotenera sp.]